MWAVGIVTYIVATNHPAVWASSVVTMCSAIVLAYIGGSKAIDFRHGPEMEEEHECQK